MSYTRQMEFRKPIRCFHSAQQLHLNAPELVESDPSLVGQDGPPGMNPGCPLQSMLAHHDGDLPAHEKRNGPNLPKKVWLIRKTPHDHSFQPWRLQSLAAATGRCHRGSTATATDATTGTAALFLDTTRIAATAATRTIAASRDQDRLRNHLADLDLDFLLHLDRHASRIGLGLDLWNTRIRCHHACFGLLLGDAYRILDFHGPLFHDVPAYLDLPAMCFSPHLTCLDRACPLFGSDLANWDGASPLFSTCFAYRDLASSFFWFANRDRAFIGNFFGNWFVDGHIHLFGDDVRNPNATADSSRHRSARIGGATATATRGTPRATTTTPLAAALGAATGSPATRNLDQLCLPAPLIAGDGTLLGGRDAFRHESRSLLCFLMWHHGGIDLLHFFRIGHTNGVGLCDVLGVGYTDGIGFLHVLIMGYANRVFLSLGLHDRLANSAVNRPGPSLRDHHNICLGHFLRFRNPLVHCIGPLARFLLIFGHGDHLGLGDIGRHHDGFFDHWGHAGCGSGTWTATWRGRTTSTAA